MIIDVLDVLIPVVCTVLAICVLVGKVGYHWGYSDGVYDTDNRNNNPHHCSRPSSKGGTFIIGENNGFEDVGNVRGSRVFVIVASAMNDKNRIELVPQADGSTCLFLCLTLEVWNAIEHK